MYDTRVDLVAPYAFSRMIYSSNIRKSDPRLKDREILKERIKEAKKNKVNIEKTKQPPLANPYKDPEWKITLPTPSWSGHVGTGHFKGCLNPICRQPEYKNQCTSNTRFDIFSYDGVVTCKIFLKGKHCDAFYPDPRVLPMNPKVKKEAAVLLKDRTVSNDQVKRSLNEKFKVSDSNNKAFEPSLQQLSQERYRAKIEEIGHSRDAFKNALSFLEDLPNDVRVIKKVGLDSVENMTETNFTFILYSETALKRCKDNLSHIAGWDALWKFASMSNLKKRDGKIPLSAWTSLDGNNRPTVVFLVISDDYNHRIITTAVRAIRAELIEKKYIDNFKKLSVMIDDGAAEKKAFSNLSLNWLLCKFHMMKAINGWIEEQNKKGALVSYSTDDIANLKGLIYRMYACKEESKYCRLYQHMSETYPEFCPYFDKEYHAIHNHWIAAYRSSCFSLFNTNNGTIHRVNHQD